MNDKEWWSLRKGVMVREHSNPVSWCSHCKKAHDVSEFSNALIGPNRKLSVCEKARAARRQAAARTRPLTRIFAIFDPLKAGYIRSLHFKAERISVLSMNTCTGTLR